MTTTTGLQIVDAERKHIPFIAWVLLTSNRSHLPKGLWDLLLGDDEEFVLRFLEEMADAKTLSWCHHSLFLVAEVDGVPAAALCGFFEDELRGDTVIAAAMQVNQKLGRSPEDYAAGWERAKSILALTALTHQPHAWVVEHVASSPEFRRRGIVETLIGEMMARGRERGAKTVDIGVLTGNDPGQRLYEKCGFEVVDEVRNAEFEAAYGAPGARMMRRPL